MLPLKKILCPTDFSGPSCMALDRACELAQYFSAELLVVNVVLPVPTGSAPVHPIGFNVPSYQKQLRENTEKSLEELIRERIPDEVEVRGIVLHGQPADEIIRVAKDEDVDIIVISTHGGTGLDHLIFGSVAEKVIRYADHPVLTIRTAGWD